jgi:outer membrane protein TolC
MLLPGLVGCHWEQFWVRQPGVVFPPSLQRVNQLESASKADLATGAKANVESFPQDGNGRRSEVAEDKLSGRPSSAAKKNQDGDKQVSVGPVISAIAAEPKPTSLTLDEVMKSVLASLPHLKAVYEEVGISQGNFTASQGNYDLYLSGTTSSQPISFYENYRNSVSLSQNIMANGAKVYGGYRVGRGSFAPWYKEQETNEGGEFSIGTTFPLRKDRLIDSRRAELFRAQQDLQGLDPRIRFEQNMILRDARVSYWTWLAAGQTLRTQRRLLELATGRAKVIETLVDRGDLPELSRIDNQRLIAQRQAKFVDATRKFQAASIKLSLYLRDEQGAMLLPSESFVADFPPFSPVSRETLNDDICRAIANHPELQAFGFEVEKARINVAEARNLVMGKLDGFAETSQDVGAPASSLRDKSPLDVQVGLVGEVPLQRRYGCGKLTAAQARLRQLGWKQEFLANKINAAVQDNYSAMENAHERFQRARENVTLSMRAMQIGRKQFDDGDIDLVVLNIYEQAEADAEFTVIEAELDFYIAQTEYLFALGEL